MSTTNTNVAAGNRRAVRHTVNRTLLLATLAVIVVAAPLGYFVHRYQKGRLSGALLDRAEKAENEKQWSKATEYYQQYLVANPDNTEVLVRLVEAYAIGDPSPSRLNRLNSLLYRALGRVPERHDLREMLAKNLLMIGSFADAEQEAQKVIKYGDPASPTARRVIALSRFAIAQIDKSASAADALSGVVALCDELPGDAELVAVAANTLRAEPSLIDTGELPSAERADQLMDRLVEQDPNNVDARVARYSYRTRYNLPDTDRDLDAALALAPENVDVLILSAVAKLTSANDDSQRAAADAQLRKAIELAPTDPRGYLLLAALFDEAGKRSEAIELLVTGADATGKPVEFGVEIAKLQLVADQITDAKSTINQLARDVADYGVGLNSATRINFENELTILQARLDVAENKVADALKKLEDLLLTSVTSSDSRHKEQSLRAAQMAAMLEDTIGRSDRARDYRAQIAELAPGDPRAVRAAAEGRLAIGDSRGAVFLLDNYARLNPLTAELQLQRVRAHLSMQLERPPSDRIWTEFEQALTAARAELPDRWEVVMAEVNYRLARGENDQVAELLRSAEESQLQQPEFWRAAVIAYERLGDSFGADRERALVQHSKCTSPVDHAQFEAALLVRQGRFDDADKLITSLRPTLDASEQSKLDRSRAELLAASGKLQPAFELFTQLVNANPEDVSVLTAATEFAIRIGELDTAAKWEEKLQAATSNADDVRYLRAMRLLAGYQNLDKSNRANLATDIVQLRRDRPRWPAAAVLSAEAAALRGDPRQALDDYQAAYDLGDRNPRTMQALVVLLYQFGRFDAANTILSQMNSAQSTDPFIEAMSIELAVRQGGVDAALQIAKNEADRRPDNASARINLANLLLRSGDEEGAVQALRDAAKSFPNDDRVWTAYFNTLVRTQRVAKARETLSALLATTVLPADRRHEIAAQGFQQIGDLQAARQQYELALALQPQRSDIRLRYAQLLFDTAPATSRKEFEKVLQSEPKNVVASRGLAMLLAASGSPEDWNRANQLLQVAAKTSTGTSEDDRLRAMLLANKGRTRAEKIANCQLAIQILEQLIDKGIPEENVRTRLLCAQILERAAILGQDDKLLLAAQGHLQALADRDPPAPQQISEYIEFLVRHCRADSLTTPDANATAATSERPALRDSFFTEAEARIDQLSKLTALLPGGIDRLIVAHSAQLQSAAGRLAEAQNVIKQYASKFADSQAAIPQRELLAIGNLYSTIAAYAEAETWFRRAMEENPNVDRLVVQSLVAQGKRNEAVAMALERAGGQVTPELALTLASILTTTDVQAEPLPEAEAVLTEAQQLFADRSDVVEAAAVVKASRGDYEEAITLFRRLVELNPENVVALNNLATLLAERPSQRTEALELIERAIKIGGPDPMLLDTQGTIFVKINDFERAIACLEEATSGGIADARYYLHLAAAYHGAGRSDEAAIMLKEARLLGLERFVLTSDDRELLFTLDTALSSSI